MNNGLLIIGAGNMGSALVAGIIKGGSVNKKTVWVFDVVAGKADKICRAFGVRKSTDAVAILPKVTTVLIAVKPADVRPLVEKLSAHLATRHLVISIAAGTSIRSIQTAAGKKLKVIRVMPNTPALVGAGISAAAGSENVSKAELKRAFGLLRSVGEVVIVPEKMMDAVTGLSGSGPAYVYMFMESLVDGGIKVGLPADIARKLAIHTVLGSAKIALQTGESFSALRHVVTSPGGTTIAGCKALEDGKFRSIIISAVEAAAKRSAELGA